jgi:hypothetical protein
LIAFDKGWKFSGLVIEREIGIFLINGLWEFLFKERRDFLPGKVN